MTKETRVKISKHFLHEYKKFLENFTSNSTDLENYTRERLKVYLYPFIINNYKEEWDTELPNAVGATDNFLDYIISTIYEELKIEL